MATVVIRVFFVVLFAVVLFFMLYLESEAYGAVHSLGVWDSVAVFLPCAIAFEDMVLAYWAWVDDDRLDELERKTQNNDSQNIDN